MQRQLALEVIITLSETAAAMLRKHTAIVAQCGEISVYHLFLIFLFIVWSQIIWVEYVVK